MNKQIALLSTLAASLLVSFSAQAADTAELKVKGVIRPSACTPSFTGSNVVDYGTISGKDLSAGRLLEEKTLAFTVTCDAATKVAVRTIDNKASTVVAGLVKTINAALTDKQAYGLGAAAGKNIGAYSVRFIPSTFTADGATPDLLVDAANNGTWAKSNFGRFNGDGTNRQSFAPSGTTTPTGYKTISGSVGVTAVLDKNPSVTTNIDLDGSATIEVQYL